ncbi:hypothetical protein [Rhodococcus qingshengii]|uniref:hypothetical protein n=1 Tax=Rhodococcus qingshengii TaxID=334542 RepID=UPI0035DB1AC5
MTSSGIHHHRVVRSGHSLQIAVSKRLAAAGFSRMTESNHTNNITEGFRVKNTTSHPEDPVVYVRWHESLEETVERMTDNGLSSVQRLPDNPLEIAYATAYADVLSPRYRVSVLGERSLLVRPMDGRRTVGAMKAYTVRVLLAQRDVRVAGDGTHQDRGLVGACVLQESDHVRIHVRPWLSGQDLAGAGRMVLDALTGWECVVSEDVESVVIKVTDK